MAYDVDSTHVYVVTSGSSATRRLTQEPAIDKNPGWSGDGEWSLFTSNRGGSGVWKIRPEDEEPVSADIETYGRVSSYDNMTYGMAGRFKPNLSLALDSRKRRTRADFD